MGNFLSFIDIYNRTYIAANGGDLMTVVYQVARFSRRLIDFESMLRETQFTATTVNRLTSYLNYYSTIDQSRQDVTPEV